MNNKTNKFSQLLIMLIIIKQSELLSNSANNDLDESEDMSGCICVPYWQCKEDYSGIIEQLIDFVDIRSLKPQNGPCTGYFDVCCKIIECGKRRSSLEFNSLTRNKVFNSRYFYNFEGPTNSWETRILGENNEALFGEFPWMLGILLKNNTYRCGGSLIHPKVAVTAAHCLHGLDEPFIIRAGEWDWENVSEPLPHQDRFSDKVIIHPHYHPGSLRNDIALIILVSPFQLAENVGLACLPPQGARFDNRRCIATGWGKNNYRKGKYQTTLKKVDLPVVPNNVCTKSLQMARLGPMFYLHRSFICAGGEAMKDTCKGDGGSPLICPTKDDSSRYEQIGIVSWGLTCGLLNTPGVYVNVALYTEWIDKEMMLHNFSTHLYRYSP